MSEIINVKDDKSFTKLTANQLFKQYKDEGGTLNFSDWLTREKTKGIFPLNSGLNEEINLSLETEHNDKRVAYFRQAENGLWSRMALLLTMIKK